MRQLRAVTIVIFGIAVLAPGILAVGHAVAQGEGKRTAPGAVVSATRPIAERDFDVDWHQASGQPSILSGCVYNRYGALAVNVRAGVEGLDATGAVIASTTAWVPDVSAGSYSHFEVPVLPGSSKYRVNVVAYQWMQAR